MTASGQRVAVTKGGAVRIRGMALADRTGAVAALYLEHAPTIERIARLEGLDASAADDLVQRTFLHLLRALERVDHERPLGPYVATVARNLLRNDRRSLGIRQHAVPSLSQREELRQREDPPDYQLDAKALLARVHAWLRTLPAEQRRVLVATRIEGRSYAELSEEIGKAPDALRQLVRRAVTALCLSLGFDPSQDQCVDGPCPWCSASEPSDASVVPIAR